MRKRTINHSRTEWTLFPLSKMPLRNLHLKLKYVDCDVLNNTIPKYEANPMISLEVRHFVS